MGFDIGGRGGRSFQFDNIGDTVTGTIVEATEQQQTDLDSGEPKFWDPPHNRQPAMMFRLTLATQLRDPNNPADDGLRDVYLRGSAKPESQSSLAAVLGSIRQATGGTEIEEGRDVLTLTYAGDGQSTGRGKNPPKLYTASYSRPPVSLAGTQQAAAAPQPAWQHPAPPAAPNPYAGAPQWAQPAPPAPAGPNGYGQPYPQQQPAQPVPATPPAPPQPAPAAPPQLTPEQAAALQAAGIDPAAWQQAQPAQ